MNDQFVDELQHLLNRYSKDAFTGVPDFILAAWINHFIQGVGISVSARSEWFGKEEK